MCPRGAPGVCRLWRLNLVTAAAAGPCWCERIEWRHGHSDIRAERPIDTSSVRQTLRSPVSSCCLLCHAGTQPNPLQFLPAVPKKKNLQQGSRRNPAVLAIGSLFARSKGKQWKNVGRLVCPAPSLIAGQQSALNFDPPRALGRHFYQSSRPPR